MKKQITLTVVLVAVGLLLCACPPPPMTKNITICKQTIPPGGTGFSFLWTNGSSGSPVAWTTLDDTQCSTVNVMGKDLFNKFTEIVPAGSTLTNITCDDSHVKFLGANENWSSADGAFNPGDDTVGIDLSNTNATCTFVNQQPPACCAYTFAISTGRGNGGADPLWTVDGGTAYITAPDPAWTGMSPAQWIQPVASPTPSASVPANTTFQYQISFNVPDCPSGSVELTGRFAADNSATAFLDGNAIPGASCPGPICFNSPQAPVQLYVPSISPGSHILQINVTNQGGESGLIVNAQVKRQCP